MPFVGTRGRRRLQRGDICLHLIERRGEITRNIWPGVGFERSHLAFELRNFAVRCGGAEQTSGLQGAHPGEGDHTADHTRGEGTDAAPFRFHRLTVHEAPVRLVAVCGFRRFGLSFLLGRLRLRPDIALAEIVIETTGSFSLGRCRAGFRSACRDFLWRFGFRNVRLFAQDLFRLLAGVGPALVAQPRNIGWIEIDRHRFATAPGMARLGRLDHASAPKWFGPSGGRLKTVYHTSKL